MYRKTFEELSKDELYAMLQLRQQVFIVEQNSIYSDLDDCDQQSIHFLDFSQSGSLTVYARYRQDKNANEVKIERVVLDKSVRGTGQGKQLMKLILHDITDNFSEAAITLSSQIDVCQFYRELGFTTLGESYDDGGVEHIKMLYQR